MTLEQRVQAFVTLGEKISTLPTYDIDYLVRGASSENGWFDEESVKAALKGISVILEASTLEEWVNKYTLSNTFTDKHILVIMAGNIPLVGFHDAFTTLLSGHKLLAKLGSQDTFLMKWILRELQEIAPDFTSQITFLEGKAEQVDGVIATGSDNSARYFQSYFGKYPNIIRKNRTSIAVIKGDESAETLGRLQEDILRYYGLGCRNISKIYIPEGYDLKPLLGALEKPAMNCIQNHKYSNNYDYNKSVYLVNKVPHLDNGGLMMRETSELVSPIAVTFYETYQNGAELKQILDTQKEKIQCIVTDGQWLAGSYNFGDAQYPKVDDYADGVDTMAFLQSL
ncbi:acyl-CoA reductase [Algivirga pacifica]|uniref:Acyl-CoA reductase n=1 Tax=Algivirga pacifica TaxID=1162670 RepID=A0ABP9D9J1_9BACT